jgi:Ribonuclease G/E
MKGQTVILDHLDGREAAALMVDGKLNDLFIASDAPAPGTIYRARADKPVKGQGGIFLSTPDGTAFLRQVKGSAPGDRLLVQVTGYAEDGKAIPVTTKVLFKSRYAIVTPDAPGLNISRSIRDDDRRDELLAIAHEEMGDQEFGLILRSSCAEADAEEIAEDVRAMLAIAAQVMGDDGTDIARLAEGDTPHLVAWREWTDPADIVTEPGGFEDHGVLDSLDQLHGGPVSLGAGAFMYVEPTRALVAVDVNTGRDTSPAAGTKANFDAARDLPRVLRVLGLGGQVVIDLAPMPKKDRRVFEQVLRAALKADTEETIMAGWTPLGNFELQRKRGRVALSDIAT